mgnify:CR=1 FL=1
MSTKGLSKKIIVDEAVVYIEENGRPDISLHEIARRLGIKTPSLYNHIENTKELQYSVFKVAIEKFVKNQNIAIKNKQKDEAVKAFAKAYHTFATENRGLYLLIMSMPSENDEISKKMAVPLLDIVINILSKYNLPEEKIAHWQRVFRAILHGFISQEYLGYFYYYSDIDLNESREIAIKCFLDGLHAEMKGDDIKK